MNLDDTPAETARFPTSRRTALRTGALTVAGVVLALSGSGPAAGGGAGSAAADGPGAGAGDTRPEGATSRARMYAGDFYQGARFRVVSDPLAYRPETPVQEGEAFLADLYWNDHETRIVRYANTGERVLFFPALDAGVETGDRYRTGRIRSTRELAEGIVTVGFGPADDGTDR